MKKQLFIIGFLILVLSMTGCSEIQESLSTERTYSDADETIEITTPSDYVSYDDDQYLISIGNDVDQKYLSIIGENKEDIAYEYTLEEYKDDLLAFWASEYGVEVVDEDEVKVNGNDAYAFENTYSLEGYNFKALSYVIETEDAFYTLDAYTLSSDYDDYEDEFEAIMESFDEK